jgi:DNA polymerase-3 subunit gamma/tau
VPGSAPSQPAPAAAPAPTAAEAPAAPASGGLDATAVRRSWDAILDVVNGRKRTTKALLLNAQVLDVQGRAVTLGFTTAALARTFQQGTNEAVLKDSLQAVLGLDATLVVTTGGEAPPPMAEPTYRPAAPAPAAAEPPPAPAYEGFAPGDEIEPEDPDNPQGERIAGGEDAALALLKDQLGGTVVED